MTRINRRQFLGALLGVGATLALTTDLAEATPSQINQVWKALKADPFVFEVNEYGTIVETGDNEPRIRRDVYDIDTAYIKSMDDLILEIDQHDELRWHFQGLAPEAYENSDDGWREWLEQEQPRALPVLLAKVDEWLDDDVDWSQMEFWPNGWSAQGKALNFFRQFPWSTLEEMGVVIVEGEHPGSTYYAAELRMDIDSANAAIERLGLPFMFKAEAA